MNTNLNAILTELFPAYIRDLEMLVNLDCGTYNKAGVDRVGRLMQDRFGDFGARIEAYRQETYGNCLYGKWQGRGKARLVLIGHMDTVYSDGTASQFPFRRKGARALGPGVSDMKSGLLSGLYAIHALVSSGFDEFAEIGLFCNSEEEVGSPVSRDLYAPLARQADAALILEAGRESGGIVSARKGSGWYVITARGKSAHAGVEPEKGANAILAMARYTQALQALNSFRPGLTLNVGVVRGGTRPNVVAELAEAEMDVRILRAADEAPLEQAIRDILAQQVVPGVTAEVRGGLQNPPMEKTTASAHLVELAKRAARDAGFEVEDVATGGASDGNYTASYGAPTIDGLGPVGGKAHNAMEEWLNVDTIVPRAVMLANLMRAIAAEKG